MDALADFPVVISLSVRWGDMDAFRHVNNTVYFRYFESARIAYFERTGISTAGDNTAAIGPILASTSCRFKAPLTYPDAVRVGARVTEIGDDRFTMAYSVTSERLSREAARGDGVIVAYDYAAARKAPLPASWRQAIEALEALER